LADKKYADHLMAKAFKLEYENKTEKAKIACQWSLVLTYCLQMGTDGIGLFYSKLIKGSNKESLAIFGTDLEDTFSRIKRRCHELREKAKDKEVNEENSNLTPEQAEAFKTFPKYFQDALLSNDMDAINNAFEQMDEQLSQEVMEKCQTTGLIRVLDKEEADKIISGENTGEQLLTGGAEKLVPQD
jgi:ribosomal protein S20